MVVEVALAAGIPVEVILGKQKSVSVCDARHVYWFLLCENGFHYQDIARLSNVHRASVQYGIKRIEDQLKVKDERIYSLYERVKNIKRHAE